MHGRRQARYPLVFWFGLGICCLFLLSSCNSKKYLLEDQSFLRENKIQIKSKHKVDDASDLKEKLSTLYLQEQTKTVFGIARHTFYYQYQESLERRPTRKKWSEDRLRKNKPIIYDSTLTVRTTERFESYLASRGYRSAKVDFVANTIDSTKTLFLTAAEKKTYVTYKVDPGPRLYIDSMIFLAADSSLQQIIQSNIKETFLPPGSPLDIELYNQERSRLTGLFQNEGYARFDETYIPPLEVDTSTGVVKATFRILNASDSILHKKYYVGDVTIFTDFQQTDTRLFYDTIVRNITYVNPQPEMTLKPEAIERNIFLREGDLVRRDNVLLSLRNLRKMEIVRFINRNEVVDTMEIDSPKINYTLSLTRNSKIYFGGNVELTYSSIDLAQSGKSLFGTSAGINYRDLNLFKGAEIFSLHADGGIEFNYLSDAETENNNFINSYNYGGGASVSLPRFMDPLRLYSIIGYSRSDDEPALMGNKLKRWLLYDATTSVNLDANFIFIRDLYDYYTINAGLSYLIKPDDIRSLTINRIGFDIFVPNPSDSFEIKVLSQSRFQRESFGKYLFTGLLFRGYSYSRDTPFKKSGSVVKLDHSFELSGLEVWAVNEISNVLTKTNNEFVLGTDNPETPESELIRFSKFAKAEMDFRYFYNFNSKIQLAFRFNPGLASAFQPDLQQVPYIKQFFVGGALSNRAWQIRELGPGGYRDLVADTTSFAFYQTGDLKIDMSVELRFPLFWYFDGAVFIDAANVWTLNKEDPRGDSEFALDRFYKEFGIGYGFGIRMDLDFFIIRADFGYKLHSPFELPLRNGSKFYKQKFPVGYVDINGDNRGPELQIGVGLPFD